MATAPYPITSAEAPPVDSGKPADPVAEPDMLAVLEALMEGETVAEPEAMDEAPAVGRSLTETPAAAHSLATAGASSVRIG